MTPELKAAAELYEDGSITERMLNAIILADAYLDEHDATPVDEAWLKEQGFAQDDMTDLARGRVFVSGNCLFASDTTDCDDFQVSVLVKTNPTRGDVLRLLSVVGKESE